jgi:hypothetical protein
MKPYLKKLDDAIALSSCVFKRIEEPLRQVLIKYQHLHDAAEDYIHGDASAYQRLVDAVDDLEEEL